MRLGNILEMRIGEDPGSEARGKILGVRLGNIREMRIGEDPGTEAGGRMRMEKYQLREVVCQVGEHQHQLAHQCSVKNLHT